MKAILIIDALFPYLNANTSIAYRIAEELSLHHGVDVVMVGMKSAENVIYPYPTVEISETYDYVHLVPGHLPKLKKLWEILTHPTCLRFQADKLLHGKKGYPSFHLYRKAIRLALQQHPDADCLVAFCCPQDAPLAAAEFADRIPVVFYELDPWGMHQILNEPYRWQDEKAADEKSAAIITTPPIYREYQAGLHGVSADKVYPMEFPNLLPPVETTVSIPPLEAGKIHCAYIGTLYNDIRNPAFMFDLFRNLEDHQIVLHIIGNLPGQTTAYEPLPANVVLHGRLPFEEAMAYMRSMDVLVNIGNTLTNQLPSKIFDYISCGKPILNICKMKDCLSLPYLNRYPLSLSLQEEDGLDCNAVDQVAAFCKASNGQALPFGEVVKLFPECTPSYVGDHVYRILRDVVTKGTP